MRRRHPLARVGQEALEFGHHRVREAEPWTLSAKRQAGAGEDHRAHDEVVRERGVDAAERVDDARARRSTLALDVGVELGVGELGEGLDLEALVLVLDVDGQQAADVGDCGP